MIERVFRPWPASVATGRRGNPPAGPRERRSSESALYRLRRLAATAPVAAATAAAAPTTVATTLALFRFRVRPVIFPATFEATATACPRTRATVFPACLTVFLANRLAICPPWRLARAPAAFARLTACAAAFLIFAMCCSPDHGLLDQLRHEQQRCQRITMLPQVPGQGVLVRSVESCGSDNNGERRSHLGARNRAERSG